MRSQRRRAPAVVIAAFAGFVAGAITMAIFDARAPWTSAAAARLSDDCGQSTFAAAPDAPARPEPAAPGAVAKPEPPSRSEVPEIGPNPIGDLRARHLRLPVAKVDADDLVRSFADKRGGDRLHEAIDILAPRHTPVFAVEDGVLAKFFFSKAGGTTIYQFDPTSTYAYYYAHLDRYAPGVKEGDRVKKGQVIGYVGTTGNAPPDTPHLHFAIFKLTDKKQWWKGTPIDPYDVWR
jgi:murein DD-endopeptidase MepM/ murein hydrolase activator NlpD